MHQFLVIRQFVYSLLAYRTLSILKELFYFFQLTKWFLGPSTFFQKNLHLFCCSSLFTLLVFPEIAAFTPLLFLSLSFSREGSASVGSVCVLVFTQCCWAAARLQKRPDWDHGESQNAVLWTALKRNLLSTPLVLLTTVQLNGTAF